MNRHAKRGLLESGPSSKDSAAGGRRAATVAHGSDTAQPLSARPLVLITRGRVEYTAKCPGCANWHRHRKLGDVQGPCGIRYELQPRRSKGATR